MKRYFSWQEIVRAIASKRTFWLLVAFFVFESVWIAVSARYPMAFDEEFHLGVIKLYAHNHFSPFFSGQPTSADAFGAITTDPSYLYHYLMAFPYRLVAAVTDSLVAQVIFLRLLNVGLAAAGLVMVRKLFQRINLSTALTNAVIAVFVLIPIVPLLAGQINYDNFLLLIIPSILLLTVKIMEGLHKKRILVAELLLLASVLLLTSVVKYAFLPIAGAIVLFLAYYAVRSFWRTSWRQVRKAYRAGISLHSRKVWTGLFLLLVLGTGLFAQRYIVNLVAYHEPVPDCAAVLNEERCMAFGPWRRDHEYAAQKPQVDPSRIAYMDQWFHAMLLRSTFAINGPFSTYFNRYPLYLPQTVFKYMSLVGLVLVVVFSRKIFRGRPALQLFLLAMAAYVAALWYSNYHGYLQTGEPTAINGRYLLLMQPYAMALVGLGFVRLLQLLRLEKLKPWLVLGVIAALLQGGGFITFILHSDASWYWQNSPVVTNMNSAARTVLRPLVWERPSDYFLKYL